jgi:hypothetical protein
MFSVPSMYKWRGELNIYNITWIKTRLITHSVWLGYSLDNEQSVRFSAGEIFPSLVTAQPPTHLLGG